MSYARIALRLAAIEALCPSALGPRGPWPTAAGPRVYDSRMTPIAQAKTVDALSAAIGELEDKPVLVVFTEDHVSEPKPGSDYHAEVEMVDLLVQISIGARGAVEMSAPDGSVRIEQIPGRITDAALEAKLDALEGHVRRLLHPRNRFASAALFRRVAMELRDGHSYPERDADRATRFGLRTLKLRFKINQDAWPQLPASPSPSGFDLLPEPLRSVAKAVAPGSAAARLCAVLAEITPLPDAAPPLATVAVYAEVDRTHDPAIDAATVAAAGAPSDVKATALHVIPAASGSLAAALAPAALAATATH